MECGELTERAIARLTGQLPPEEAQELETHLASCEACRGELAALERAWEFLGEDRPLDVSPEFRRRTRALLQEEMLRARVRQFTPRRRVLRIALRAAAVVAAAGLGYLAAKGLPGGPGAGGAVERPSGAVTPVARAVTPTLPGAAVPGLEGNPRLENVSYKPADKDGHVAIAFDLTTRHEIDGKPTDPDVAKLLAYLVAHNAETAGEKSRAIELVSEHYGAAGAPASPEIVAALTTTLRKDGNPGVRKKAADALASFAITPEIRAAFLEALKSDSNPAVRLVAVDALAASAKQSPDESTIQSLREKAVDPQENGFVRAKAASALKAISF